MITRSRDDAGGTWGDFETKSRSDPQGTQMPSRELRSRGRLYGVDARGAPAAVLFRRGPSKTVLLIRRPYYSWAAVSQPPFHSLKVP